MKLIQALKKIKDLRRKVDDLQIMIRDHSADLSHETPVYPDQRQAVDAFVQARQDILKEILRLRIAIQRTNLCTPVTVTFMEREVTKSIAEWIHMRKDLAALELASYTAMTDRSLKEGVIRQSNGTEQEVKIRRYYDPKTRDSMKSMLQSAPSEIDATLEVANAVTDLIE